MATQIPRTMGILAVGVDNCHVFNALQGAASGADTICDWAHNQEVQFGITVHVEKFTDAGGKDVQLQQVQAGAQALLSKGLDVLVVYFSGHGICKAGDDEHVLLSHADTFPGNSISVAATISAAWMCGVPHVILISDACRSPAAPNTPAGRVAGGPVLFEAIPQLPRGVLDIFYATGPYAVAVEIDGQGLLTDELDRALKAPAPAFTSAVKIAGNVLATVVPSPMVVPLASTISNRAAALQPAKSISPDFRVMSGAHPNLFFGFVDPSMVTTPSPTVPSAPSAPSMPAEYLTVELIGRMSESIESTFMYSLGEERQMLREETAEYAAEVREEWISFARGNSAFRDLVRSTITHRGGGLFVVGEKVTQVVCPSAGEVEKVAGSYRGTCFSFKPRENEHVGTAVLLFRSGTCAFLPVLEGYVGRVGVRNGMVESLSYRPLVAVNRSLDRQLDDAVALAESLARSGKLYTLGKRQGIALAKMLRYNKAVDPMLGVLASYAYSQNGDIGGAASVFQWMKDSDAAVPFDVCMLAGQITEAIARRRPGFSPCMPLLTLGWSIAHGSGTLSTLHPSIQALAPHRLNALYSTFNATDVRDVIRALRQGVLR